GGVRVWAVAEEGGGFPWLGTDEGLIRFAGVRFVQWNQIGSAPLPRLSVRSLKVAHDKSLWIGFGSTGGVARIQGRNVRVYGESDGATNRAGTATAHDRRRRVWAAAANRLFRLDGVSWQRSRRRHRLREA